VRVSSTAGHSIELGVVAAMLLPIAHHYVLRAGSNNQRIFRLAAAGLLVASLTFAGSRAGFVGLAVVGLTLAWGWSTRARFQGLILMLFGLVAFKALLPGLMGTLRYLFLNFGSDDSITGRTDDYEVIFDYIRTRPILGRGPGTFVPDQYLVLDNEYLYSAVTIGLVGLSALAAIVVVALMQAGWVAHHAGTNETRHLGQALKASILVGVVASATFDSMSFATFSSVWFIVFGAAAALWRIERDGIDTDIDPKARSDFSQVVVSGRLTDPSAGHRSVLQTVNDYVEERAAR
jgi:O-antigen ligase